MNEDLALLQIKGEDSITDLTVLSSFLESSTSSFYMDYYVIIVMLNQIIYHEVATTIPIKPIHHDSLTVFCYNWSCKKPADFE